LKDGKKIFFMPNHIKFADLPGFNYELNWNVFVNKKFNEAKLLLSFVGIP